MTASTSTPTAVDAAPVVPQHRLFRSVLLHLAPGAALTAFVLFAAPVVISRGFPAVFALFVGIPLVIVPVELGVLLGHAKRTTGTFSLRETVVYRERLPARRLVPSVVALFLWFTALLVVATAVVDAWIAQRFFGWLPEAILQFAAVEDGAAPLVGSRLVILLVVAFVFNGVVGPVVEELYFRGYLLPRLDRLGRMAPVLNTVLFSLYHFWTPWQNLTRIVGFLPLAWATRRTRSIQLAIATHVTINLVFLLGLLATFLGDPA